ncbi:hypothetical protein M2175_004274 [Bradyrhizobium elkanii]|nr:hypothetical protein [Bradyrhizobium elkanii]MCS3969799.1 hypothetical protein [Bradyrhizobium japonicum]
MPEVRRVKVGSIAAAVRGYYGSTEFKVLAETTKATYRGVLDRFADKHGEGPIWDSQATTPGGGLQLL